MKYGGSSYDKSNLGCEDQGLRVRTWRFRYIETYLLLPSAIGRAAGLKKEEVISDARKFSVELVDFTGSEIPIGLRDLPSKSILTEGTDCLVRKYKISKYDIAKEIQQNEIHQDISNLIAEINTL